MFDEYEDYFTEPSEVDTIIQQAQADIAALFSEKVKHTLDEAAEAEKRLSRLQSEIRSAQYQLSDIESKIKDAQERCDNAELFDIPRRYIQKFVRNATGDYAPGDTVWKITDKGKSEPCCTCGGAKKVKAILGNREVDVTCPECGGRGSIWRKNKIAEKRKVAAVYLKLCFEENRVNYWNRECVYLNGDEYCSDISCLYPTEVAANAALAEKENKNA